MTGGSIRSSRTSILFAVGRVGRPNGPIDGCCCVPKRPPAKSRFTTSITVQLSRYERRAVSLRSRRARRHHRMRGLGVAAFQYRVTREYQNAVS